MNFFITIVFVFICLFAGNAWSGEYQPVPDIIDAMTESPIDGQLHTSGCRLYPSDGIDRCYTDAENEAANTVGSNNVSYWDQCWTSDSHGPCQKCSSAELTLRSYNGTELCVRDCSAPYQLGSYNGTDGCITCPDLYTFRDEACRWNGPGPPPPPPPPTTPANLTASDGTSAVNVKIKWNTSNYITDYYILERAAGREKPFIWWKIGKIRAHVKDEYYDKSAKVATWYSYRIKACNDDNQCSDYSNIDKGSKALETPEPVRVEIPGDNPTWVKVSWSSVPAADGYLILIAEKTNRYFARFGFDYSDDYTLRYNGEIKFWLYLGRTNGNNINYKKYKETDLYFPLLKEKNRAVFLLAFKIDDSGTFLSYPAVWNPPGSVPIFPSVRLLLSGEQEKNKK